MAAIERRLPGQLGMLVGWDSTAACWVTEELLAITCCCMVCMAWMVLKKMPNNSAAVMMFLAFYALQGTANFFGGCAHWFFIYGGHGSARNSGWMYLWALAVVLHPLAAIAMGMVLLEDVLNIANSSIFRPRSFLVAVCFVIGLTTGLCELVIFATQQDLEHTGLPGVCIALVVIMPYAYTLVREHRIVIDTARTKAHRRQDETSDRRLFMELFPVPIAALLWQMAYLILFATRMLFPGCAAQGFCLWPEQFNHNAVSNCLLIMSAVWLTIGLVVHYRSPPEPAGGEAGNPELGPLVTTLRDRATKDASQVYQDALEAKDWEECTQQVQALSTLSVLDSTIPHTRFTPLTLAIQTNANPQVYATLLELRANVNQVTSAGVTPVEFAVEAGNVTFLTEAQRFGAEPTTGQLVQAHYKRFLKMFSCVS